MKLRTSNLKYVLSVGILGMALFFTSSMKANAQNHNPRAERHDLRDHQRQERHQLKDQHRYQNNGYYGNNGYNNNGYYGKHGYYTNDPYYNRNNYGNPRYYTPHFDSRNGIKRGLHHLFGGH